MSIIGRGSGPLEALRQPLSLHVRGPWDEECLAQCESTIESRFPAAILEG